MAYNRYHGGNGRPERVETPPRESAPALSPLPPPETGVRPQPRPAFLALGRMDAEDWLVAAILYLAYRSSGDWEMLAALGAYLFM